MADVEHTMKYAIVLEGHTQFKERRIVHANAAGRQAKPQNANGDSVNLGALRSKNKGATDRI